MASGHRRGTVSSRRSLSYPSPRNSSWVSKSCPTFKYSACISSYRSRSSARGNDEEPSTGVSWSVLLSPEYPFRRTIKKAQSSLFQRQCVAKSLSTENILIDISTGWRPLIFQARGKTIPEPGETSLLVINNESHVVYAAFRANPCSTRSEHLPIQGVPCSYWSHFLLRKLLIRNISNYFSLREIHRHEFFFLAYGCYTFVTSPFDFLSEKSFGIWSHFKLRKSRVCKFSLSGNS